MAATAPALEFSTTLASNPVPAERRSQILASPGFGTNFTDHMVTATWTPDGWHDAGLRPYAPLALDPATAVLHYAQAIFEGLKAYRHDDGSIWAFRPRANGERMRASAARMALPDLPAESFVEAIELLVRADADWVPSGGEASLYLRPFMFASEVFLGVRPAKQVTFCVIASPAGAYFSSGVKPVDIWLSAEYTRAAPGGTGAAKCAGNYAASLVAQQEAIEHGCDQVCFLDAVERKWVEELGGMNLYFVHANGTIVTPELTGTILEGITRDSIIQLAADRGHKVDERRVSIDEWREGVASGDITEVFACGTAAVVTPIGRLAWDGGDVSTGAEPGPVTQEIRSALLDVQYGRAEDPHGWMHRIV
ncbi:branched-chain amino acid aminotransferase [Jiangella gansuensis]|uniref:branched-chain amino acid aminotransferase n=1 Tax=Jiangella gansuensis TaxID=281473 RepID=UPI0004ACE85B|nr:branched-chain amino acid aminotransferase [Jiangella gansuensis]